jgi:hypothetical protein
MFNPILGEMIAHERYKDFVRQAEQNQLANTVLTRRPAHRFDLSAFWNNLVITVMTYKRVRS